MSLVIVLDGSGSINADDFKLAKNSVVKLAGLFSLDDVNLGFVVYSETSKVIIPMDHNLTMAQIERAIFNTDYPDESTATGDAIMTGIDMLTKSQHREGRPKIMAVFTDGESNSGSVSVTKAMSRVSEMKIITFAIGIGSSINNAELTQIALKKSGHVFEMSSYQSLSESKNLINVETCKISQIPEVGRTVADSLAKGEHRFYTYNLPVEGLTIKINVSSGVTNAYFSYVIERPSSALNDGEIVGQMYIPGNASLVETNSLFLTVLGLRDYNSYKVATDNGRIFDYLIITMIF